MTTTQTEQKEKIILLIHQSNVPVNSINCTCSLCGEIILDGDEKDYRHLKGDEQEGIVRRAMGPHTETRYHPDCWDEVREMRKKGQEFSYEHSN